MAEADVGQTSHYRLIIDGLDVGKFKSSGLIVSTGTGSTGWLHSANKYWACLTQRSWKRAGGQAQHINPI